MLEKIVKPVVVAGLLALTGCSSISIYRPLDHTNTPRKEIHALYQVTEHTYVGIGAKANDEDKFLGISAYLKF